MGWRRRTSGDRGSCYGGGDPHRGRHREGGRPPYPTALADPTFGLNGAIPAPSGISGWNGVVEADGTITLGAASRVARFNPAGVADPGFGGDGDVDLVADLGASLGTNPSIRDVTTLAGGSRIVLAASDDQAHLVALTSAGALDTSFAATSATPGVLPLPRLGSATRRVLSQPLFFTRFDDAGRNVHAAPRWFYINWFPFSIGAWNVDLAVYDGDG